ncbi:MAG: nucleoid-associated protein EbfC [Desulfovibrionales bacterium]|nr:nucleoid-associated protein EbfC [Desulfovibrionales bacterium]
MRGMNEMVRQAQLMQKKISKAQEELKTREVEASAGGGMVTVKANGAQEILDVKIEPQIFEGGDAEMLQDLVLAAVNEALRQAKDMMEREMSQITGGLSIPGLM